MVFRTPTPLNSIDLQFGQRAENSPTVALIMILTLSFRGTASDRAGAIPAWRRGVGRVGALAPSLGRTARLPRYPNFFRCSDVRLRQLSPTTLPRYLALVSLL